VAYREQRYDDALVSLHRAIRLKDDEHQFYYLRGLAQLRTGNRDAARQSLQEAAEYASQDRVERAYNQKLEALRGG
jgi:Flp pilus assembly protein TadD